MTMHEHASAGARAPGLQLAGLIAILLLFYVLSFLDRSILSMLVGPLKADVRLTDNELSLLMGPAFAVLYVLTGLPVGWLVDRLSKRMIIGIGVAIWGTATFLSGLASSFAGLLFGRIGVGVGEACLTPAAHAILAERVPATRLATAMSIFTTGAVIGTSAATAIGGLIVAWAERGGVASVPLLGVVRPWQLVFFVVGAATLIALPLVPLLGAERRGEHRSQDGASAGREGLGALLRQQWPVLLGLPTGFGFTYVLNAALGAWTPTFMVRNYGWSIAQVGAAWGTQHLIAGVIGQLGGAYIVDRLYARGVGNAHTLYHIVGLAISVPAMLIALNSTNPYVFLAMSSIFYALSFPFIGYAAAAMQLFTPSHLRGQVSALFLAIATIIGTSIGAPLVGVLTDTVFADPQAIGRSMAVVVAIFGPLAFLTLLFAGRRLRKLYRQTRDADKADTDGLSGFAGNPRTEVRKLP